MALCKFVVSLANILFIVHFKVSSETRSVLTVLPNYTSRLLTVFEFRPNFLRSLVIPTFVFPMILTFLVKKKKENEAFQGVFFLEHA